MLKLHVLLLSLEVLGVALGKDSYSYTGGSGSLLDSSSTYGYLGYGTPGYSAYGQQGYAAGIVGYGQGHELKGYGYNAGTSAGSYVKGQNEYGYSAGIGNYGQGLNGYGYGATGYNGCGYMKVVEVLDSLFCEHGLHKRYTSTIYPAIEVVSNQLEYLLDFVFLPTVFDYLEAAQQSLETLQDAVYANYEDSNLLHPYNEKGDANKTEGTNEASGTSGTGTSASGGRINAASKLAAAQEKLKVHEANAQMFKTSRGLNLQKKTRAQASLSKVKGEAKQRANENEPLLGLTQVDKTVRATPQRDEDLVRKLQKTMKKLKREARIKASSRQPRASEYSDYTCALLPSSYCDTDYYDELLYNILDKLLTTLNFLDLAAFEIWLFIEQIGCETQEDRWALTEANFVFGKIITNFYTMLEVAINVERMYELAELENGDDSSGYFRAGGGSPSQSQPQMIAVPMVRRPMAVPMPINKSPISQGYPFAQYMPAQQGQAQAPVNYPSYSGPQEQQYRVGRAPQQPSVPVASQHVGASSPHSPTIYLVG